MAECIGLLLCVWEIIIIIIIMFKRGVARRVACSLNLEVNLVSPVFGRFQVQIMALSLIGVTDVCSGVSSVCPGKFSDSTLT
jgi:hypothetical protein